MWENSFESELEVRTHDLKDPGLLPSPHVIGPEGELRLEICDLC